MRVLTACGLPLLLAGCLGLVGDLGFRGDDERPPAATFADASMRLYAELARRSASTAGSGVAARGGAAAAAPRPEDDDNDSVGDDGVGDGGAGDDGVGVAPDEETPARVAALPPDNDPGIALRVTFPIRDNGLSTHAKRDLDALAVQVLRDDDLPVQILAYWSVTERGPSAAKLRALKRGLTVRSYLAEKGLRQVRIELTEVRDDTPPPRVVDVVLARA